MQRLYFPPRERLSRWAISSCIAHGSSLWRNEQIYSFYRRKAMKVIGVEILLNDDVVPIVVDCIALEVRNRGGSITEPDGYRIFMRTSHPSVSFYVIKTEKDAKTSCYKWLNKSDAEEIMKFATESDTIDLRKLGNYQICGEMEMQSVLVSNDVDDWEDIPLLVKLVKNEEE